MKRIFATLGALALLAPATSAETVLFSETFDSDYSENFPNVLDLDGHEPASDIRTLFIGTAGYYMPWWHLKDSSASTDRYIGSHSRYSTAATSSDWLGSRAIAITGSGFKLTFEAQSYTMKGTNDRISDLWVFITDSPVSRDNVPSTPTAHFENVPTGKSQSDVEGDFTTYEISLDDYVGKTIYINFANLNTDRDLLLINNVKVARDDAAELEIAEAPAYVTTDKYAIDLTVRAVENIGAYTIMVTDDNGIDTYNCDPMNAGETTRMTLTRPIKADQTLNYEVTFTDGKGGEVSKNGTVSRLTFEPWRKVLVEESTGMWCGWCPGGTNLVESMHADPEMSQYVVPVSVHVGSDNLSMPAYATRLGVPSSAPVFFVNRTNVGAPSASLDYNFDKTREGSIGKYVADRHAQLTRVGISVDASWVINGTDTTAINCVAKVTPALSDNANNLRVGFILVENNVGLDNSEYFVQTNYLSGRTGSDYVKYWSELGSYVLNLRYNDVARKITDFAGIEGSLPAELKADTEYTHSVQLEVPDTRIIDQNNVLAAPDVCRANCIVVAYVINPTDGEILNVAECPMSERATDRFTTARYYESLSGVESVTVDAQAGETTYHDLLGRRVDNPGAGFYVRRQGTRSEVVKIAY